MWGRMPVTYALIFVHGTWSTPKIWRNLESRLRAYFDKRFSIIFESIRWSGGNSAGARLEGIKTFEETVMQHSDAGHDVAVICHSHGANVVLESREEVRDRIRLLICLNSPILTTSKRPLSFAVSGYIGIVIFFDSHRSSLILVDGEHVRTIHCLRYRCGHRAAW